MYSSFAPYWPQDSEHMRTEESSRQRTPFVQVIETQRKTFLTALLEDHEMKGECRGKAWGSKLLGIQAREDADSCTSSNAP
jgi:hypothetical protein